MNRIEIKTKAKELASKNLGAFWKAAFIIVALSIGTAIFAGVLADTNSATYSLLTLIIGVLEAPLAVGLVAYTLSIVRGKDLDIHDLFKYYKYLLPILVLQIVIAVCTFLWGLLLIIPGIIAAISYSMAIYIFADGEEEPMEAIRKSKGMLKGYKADFFVFCLSFIGWAILTALTFGLLLIWTYPYIQISIAVYYDELKKIKAKEA